MKRITSEEARALRRQGVKLTTEDGKPFIPRLKVKPVQPVERKPDPPPGPKEDTFIKDTISSMLVVMNANEANTKAMLDIDKKLVETMLEVAKPKPRKNMELTVGRDKSGTINTIHVKEI